MPLMEMSERAADSKACFVGETEFQDPENESEHVKMFIYLAQADFVEEALQVSQLAPNTLQLSQAMMKHFKNNHLSGQSAPAMLINKVILTHTLPILFASKSNLSFILALGVFRTIQHGQDQLRELSEELRAATLVPGFGEEGDREQRCAQGALGWSRSGARARHPLLPQQKGQERHACQVKVTGC